MDKIKLEDFTADNTGIYFLWVDEVVVYVGISTDSILRRIDEHRGNKIFNYVSLYSFDYGHRYELESKEIELIKKYNPYYNSTHRVKGKECIIPEPIRKYKRYLTPEIGKYY